MDPLRIHEGVGQERSFGHFHIMSFHFCVCLFKALFSDSRINKYVRIVQYTIVHYNTLQYIKLRYSIEAPNKYLYCTVLFCTVLYKNEKICSQGTQNVSKTEVHSFLSGSFPDTRGSWPINTYVLFSTQ